MADDQSDDFYDAVLSMADRMGLEGEDRAKYVHEHMTRAGYDAIPQYVKQQPPEEEAQGKWTPFGGRRQQQAPAGGGGQQQQRPQRGNDESGWYT